MKENMGARDDGSPSRALEIDQDCGAEIESAGSPSWVVEIELEAQEKEWFKEKETHECKKHSIYKLPKGFVRDKHRVQLYEPQVVSFGPYHHGKEQLQAMEEHKVRSLCHVLTRTGKRLQEYWEALIERNVLQQLMDAYKDLDPLWKDKEEEFLKMMILDGCFMLEVMRVVTTNDFNDYAASDPIFSYHGRLSNLSRLKKDMLMLENQIPLLVLHKLYEVEKGFIHEQDEQKQRDPHQEVNNMVLDFFKQVQIGTPPSLKTRFMRRMHRRSDDHEVEGLHVLDLVRKSMIEDIKGWRRRSEVVQRVSYDVIWSATQLEYAGIRFKRSDSPSLKDITFQIGFLHATLSLPQLLVDDATESKFLNLMAFEHLHTGSGKEVSSYVCFMDDIIDSDKDVRLLSENNIIKNFVGTDQAVADLFNRISHDVSIDPATNLGTIYLAVVAYCSAPFNKNWAILKQRYFKAPWSWPAFVSASAALVISIVQLVYTLLGYYLHHQ